MYCNIWTLSSNSLGKITLFSLFSIPAQSLNLLYEKCSTVLKNKYNYIESRSVFVRYFFFGKHLKKHFKTEKKLDQNFSSHSID
jgi:hypothetical protein